MVKRKRESKVYEVISIYPKYASEEEEKEALAYGAREWALALYYYEKDKQKSSVAP